MKVYVLIITDRDMCPRCDITTTAVFTRREDALNAMEDDIAGMIESEQVDDSDIEHADGLDYAVSADGRFMWKVEKRMLHGDIEKIC